jgi:hypothetical protein
MEVITPRLEPAREIEIGSNALTLIANLENNALSEF